MSEQKKKYPRPEGKEVKLYFKGKALEFLGGKAHRNKVIPIVRKAMVDGGAICADDIEDIH